MEFKKTTTFDRWRIFRIEKQYETSYTASMYNIIFYLIIITIIFSPRDNYFTHDVDRVRWLSLMVGLGLEGSVIL